MYLAQGFLKINYGWSLVNYLFRPIEILLKLEKSVITL